MIKSQVPSSGLLYDILVYWGTSQLCVVDFRTKTLSEVLTLLRVSHIRSLLKDVTMAFDKFTFGVPESTDAYGAENYLLLAVD